MGICPLGQNAFAPSGYTDGLSVGGPCPLGLSDGRSGRFNSAADPGRQTQSGLSPVAGDGGSGMGGRTDTWGIGNKRKLATGCGKTGAVQPLVDMPVPGSQMPHKGRFPPGLPQLLLSSRAASAGLSGAWPCPPFVSESSAGRGGTCPAGASDGQARETIQTSGTARNAPVGASEAIFSCLLTGSVTPPGDDGCGLARVRRIMLR
jgi:hypothetical protein